MGEVDVKSYSTYVGCTIHLNIPYIYNIIDMNKVLILLLCLQKIHTNTLVIEQTEAILFMVIIDSNFPKLHITS